MVKNISVKNTKNIVLKNISVKNTKNIVLKNISVKTLKFLVPKYQTFCVKNLKKNVFH